MKISDLIKLPAESVDKHLCSLCGYSYNHVPEIEDMNYNLDWARLREENDKVEIHFFKDWDYDGRRCWTLAGVKFEGEWVMIIQNAGREGDDYANRFIINKDLYLNMVSFLKTFSNNEEDKYLNNDLVNIDDDIPDLTEFYSDSLHTPFERY